MKVEFRVEGKSIDELEARARRECEDIAAGRAFSWSFQDVFTSTGGDFPSPVARMAAAYAPRTFSTFVTAEIADRGDS